MEPVAEPTHPTSPDTRPVVLFDGVCNLCDHSVQFVLRHDPAGRFRFASLQSATGERLLHEHGMEPGALSSVVLVQDGRVYTRSDAALRIARQLNGAWSLLGGLRVVPRFLRDAVYDWVAANRYRWFGKQDACMIPAPEWRDRFLP